MTRPLPLAILALVFMWLAANVDTMWMWLITVVAVAALVALVIAMRFRDMYTGPKTLTDDIRFLSGRIIRDDGGEADRIAYMREIEEDEIERKRIIEGIDEDHDDVNGAPHRAVNDKSLKDGNDR